MWEWIAPLFSDILCASFVHSPKTSVFIRASHSNMSWQSWTTVRSTRSIGHRWWTSNAASESLSTMASFGCTPGMSVTHSSPWKFSSKHRFRFQWRFTSPKFGAAIKYHHVISRVYRVSYRVSYSQNPCNVSPYQSCGSIKMMVCPPGGTDKSAEEPMPMVTEVTWD